MSLRGQQSEVAADLGHTVLLTWRSNVTSLQNYTLRLAKKDKQGLVRVLYIKPANQDTFLQAGVPSDRFIVTLFVNTVNLVIREVEWEDRGRYIVEYKDQSDYWQGDQILLTVDGTGRIYKDSLLLNITQSENSVFILLETFHSLIF